MPGHHLPFVLISDKDKAVAKAFGADGLRFAERMTFVVGPDGRILYVNPSVDPARHDAELLKVLAGGEKR